MTERHPTVDHRLSDDESNVHYDWSAERKPALTVAPGETVRFDCRDASNGEIGPKTTVEMLRSLTFEGHPLTGPVAVEGAEPGDVLEVELLGFEERGHGFTYFYEGDAGKGLLPDAFDDPGLYVWEIDDGVAEFVDGIEVPVDPFPGCIGVAPAADGVHATTPPRRVGGNVDIKHLTAGSTLYLPIEVETGLFSIGDCHAAQGDGEVCVTAIEAAMSVTARLDLRRDMSIEEPQFRTTGPFTPTGVDEPMFATTGIADDLMTASKKAVGQMIDHLHDERRLSRDEAYILCSVAVDLKINEVVDAPNWVVSAYLPESLFPG
ncbi:acetamidase/formamidase family protein [Natronorarus salvus]|uniref:acetamidase/formamidase family protein n=1 Tax=Natronorarus salvus TaxID=3117733 RepID=UPI002F25EE7F